MTRLKLLLIALVTQIVVMAALWLYVFEPFKVTDPSDPKFDITQARARDYRDPIAMKMFLAAILKPGMSRDDVKRVIETNLKGHVGTEVETTPPRSDLARDDNRLYFVEAGCGYDLQKMNDLICGNPEGRILYAIAQFDRNEKLVEFFWNRRQGLFQPDAKIYNALINPLKFASLVIDMQKENFQNMNNDHAQIYWDVNNDNLKETTSAIDGMHGGVLAVDLNRNGTIDNQSEMFGTRAQSAFSQLKKYDTNNDGQIDRADALFSRLLIWTDLNKDGVSQPAELFSLHKTYFNRINLNIIPMRKELGDDTLTYIGGITSTDGSARMIGEIWRSYDPRKTVYALPWDVDPLTLSLPNLKGYGVIKNLHIAMSQNLHLRDMVKDIATADLAQLLSPDFDFDTRFRHVLYEWAGVDHKQMVLGAGFGEDPLNWWEQGYDLRKTTFLSKLSGEDYPNIVVKNVGSFVYIPSTLGKAWQSTLSEMEAHFLAQTEFKKLFSGEPKYWVDADSLHGVNGFSTEGLAEISRIIRNQPDKLYGWTLVFRAVEGPFSLSSIPPADLAILYDAVKSTSSTIDPAAILTSIQTGYSAPAIQETVYRSNQLSGTASDDIINGNSSSDNLAGAAGDDWLYGGLGNDTYRGGYGDDVMSEENGAGNDIYVYDSGDDVIRDSGTDDHDEIDMPAGIVKGDLTFDTRQLHGSADLDIIVKGRGTITVVNQRSTVGKIEYIRFADGTFMPL